MVGRASYGAILVVLFRLYIRFFLYVLYRCRTATAPTVAVAVTLAAVYIPSARPGIWARAREPRCCSPLPLKMVAARFYMTSMPPLPTCVTASDGSLCVIAAPSRTTCGL